MTSFDGKDGVLFDLDGTLMTGGQLLPWAQELILRAGCRAAIVTNDAEHSPSEIARKLQRAGLTFSPDRIFAAGWETVRLVAEHMPGASVMILGSIALKRWARQVGLSIGKDRVHAVVVCRDRKFSYAAMADAANAILEGAALYVANPDHTHPGRGGRIVPETGAIAASILKCTGPVNYVSVGKPDARIFKMALGALGVAAARTIMLGDNPQTDGAGAKALGMEFMLVPDQIPSELVAANITGTH